MTHDSRPLAPGYVRRALARLTRGRRPMIRLFRRPLSKVPGFCPVTGIRRCPWHPDGGNHPQTGGLR